MKFIASGKVKDLYEYDSSHLLFKFSDRVSAYDVKFNENIPKKGEVLCKFAKYWFDKLAVDDHFVRQASDTEIVVKKMKMIPMECIVRGYFYGSIVNRWKKGDVYLPQGTKTEVASKLPTPIFDPTTKSEHDIPVTKRTALEMDLVSEKQFTLLSSKSIDIYNKMSSIADSAGFILADLKLEFGLDNDDNIVLCDSIGPDECRLWPRHLYRVGKTQVAYDKQILRDWLTEQGYQKQFDDDRSKGKEPSPPPIPNSIVQKMTQRYVAAFEKITGQSL